MKLDFDLYIVSTPRQWWIACALALQFRRPAKMMIDDCFNGANDYVKLTERWSSSPFKSVELLSGKNEWIGLKSGARAWKKFLEPRKRKQQLTSLLSGCSVKSLFTSSVRDWFTQLAVNLQPGIHVAYLDDGIRTYQSDSFKHFSFFKRLNRKLHYGSWYQAPCPYSELSYLSHAYVFHPKMANSGIQALQVVELKNSWFVTAEMFELAQALLKLYRFEDFVKHHRSSNNLILTFTKLSILKRDCQSFDLVKFKRRLLAYVDQAVQSGQTVWVKYHPREVDHDVYGIAQEIADVHFIPASIPFDILISLLNEGDSMVGEISTVLFDVAARRPDVDVLSIGCLADNPRLLQPFQKVGVKLIGSVNSTEL